MATASMAVFCSVPSVHPPRALLPGNSLAFSESALFSPAQFGAVSRSDAPSSSSSSSSLLCFEPVPRRSRQAAVRCKSADERTPPTAETNPFVRLAWYGSEAFGKAAAVFRPKRDALEVDIDASSESGPVERKDAMQLLRGDLDRSYFVNGDMSLNIYEKDCEFADPFVSFRGLKRFKQNVGNLGAFMEEASLKVLDWQEYEDHVYAKWRFKCVIALPWRPILAASGSTEYFFRNDSGKIHKHVESWDISPIDGLRQLIKPNPKKKKLASRK